MTVTATAGRSMAIGNEPSLSGNETITANFGTSINIPVAVGADDAVTALAVAKADLEGLLLEADQDLIIKVLGGNPWDIATIATLGDTATANGGTITVIGDLTEWLYIGDNVWLEGCSAPANDGRYVVRSTAVAAGVTTVELVKCGQLAAADPFTIDNVAVHEVFAALQPAAAGTMTKFLPRNAGQALLGAAAAFEFNVVAAPGEIEVAGDWSFLQADDKILIEAATTGGNAGIYTVVSATYAAPDTTIVVEEALAAQEAAAGDTTIQWIRTELLIRLTADVPFLWTEEGSILNPVLEDVTQLLVTNASGVAADLEGRLLRTV